MIIPIERLKREATEAAKHHSDINAACPYPFHTDAAHAFKAFFHEALDRTRAETQRDGVVVEGIAQ